MSSSVQLRQRAIAALAGVAIGDAMGMPTQTLTREDIAALYGPITGLRAARADQPVSAGLAAGTITDDTEQSLLLAWHLITRNGRMDQRIWADELMAWEQETKARGVNDLLGPSTRQAIMALRQGVPLGETGRSGRTNGAAMRIVPVAIATPAEPLAALIDAVEESCRLTHHTSEAIGAASAVAAVVSQGLMGADLDSALEAGLAAARLGEQRGTAASAGSIHTQISAALALAGAPGADAVMLARQIGTSVAAVESIPMAFALLRLTGGNMWSCACLAAVIGDDTDTIGAIACGMAGAVSGLESCPPDVWARVQQVNALQLDDIVDGLLRLRARPVAEVRR